ncbi:hypothetical protein EDB85DRAFT_1099502 [Lactarius pseudohatsudake]|nr:hypothetical protein EDB85DRAFT_1099502 [Lactarius pseudohatsudake]
MSLRRRRKCRRIATYRDVLGQDSIRGVVDALWRSTVGFGSHPSHKSQLPTPTRPGPIGAGIVAFHLSSPRTRPRMVHFLAKGRNGVATRNRPLISGLGHREHGNQIAQTCASSFTSFKCSHFTMISARSRLPSLPTLVHIREVVNDRRPSPHQSQCLSERSFPGSASKPFLATADKSTQKWPRPQTLRSISTVFAWTCSTTAFTYCSRYFPVNLITAHPVLPVVLITNYPALV